MRADLIIGVEILRRDYFRSRPNLISIIVSILLISVIAVPPLGNLLTMPSTARIVVGEKIVIASPFIKHASNVLKFDMFGSGGPLSSPVAVDGGRSGYAITATRPGKVGLTVKFMGYIPLKSILVESLPPRQVVVGGHSIGILLQSKGLMVVGVAPISSPAGKTIIPARDSGFRVGDLILEADGVPMYSEKALADAIDRDGVSGKPASFLVKRDKGNTRISVKPVFCSETQRFRVGLYVRDGVTGVGTMTFWDPTTRHFAALGHVIVDSDTKQAVGLRSGKIVPAYIQAVQPGKPGRPGQKIGVFDRGADVIGNIKTNSPYGVYGSTNRPVANPAWPGVAPVAYAHQVEKGPAQILTVIDRDKIEKFDVVIEKVYPFRHNGKGMVIRVTDPKLLSAAGGIVQGMSGSPIMQKGKLIGAVTHVFLNNPERGYGAFVDSMLDSINTIK
ncbi:MAG: SpoIVB peptidase [Candidatus Saccharibacteria bacterium]